MPTAYVLINCDLGSEEEIIKELKKLTEVIEVSGVYGVYDIILKIKSETMDRLRETITWHVRRIDKVRSTLTMIVIEGQGEKGKRQQARSLTSNTITQVLTSQIYTNIIPPQMSTALRGSCKHLSHCLLFCIEKVRRSPPPPSSHSVIKYYLIIFVLATIPSLKPLRRSFS